MVSPNSLEMSCLGNAFIFTNSDVEKHQRINKQLHLIQSGVATPSLADAQTLLKMKVNFPGANNLVHCILHMQALFHVLLPIGHLITTFLGEHYKVKRFLTPAGLITRLPHPY
jgi:hypothetical protein